MKAEKIRYACVIHHLLLIAATTYRKCAPGTLSVAGDRIDDLSKFDRSGFLDEHIEIAELVVERAFQKCTSM